MNEANLIDLERKSAALSEKINILYRVAVNEIKSNIRQEDPHTALKFTTISLEKIDEIFNLNLVQVAEHNLKGEEKAQAEKEQAYEN